MKVSLLISALILGAFCYPEGPPDSQCGSMEPSHETTATAGVGTYSVSASATTYHAGEVITVTISTTGDAYRGLLLQARYTVSGAAVGTWAAPTSSDYQLIACTTSAGAVGHANKIDKTTAQNFYWTAPVSPTGNVSFYATVVKTYGTFHVKIPSSTLTFDSTPLVTDTATTTATASSSSTTTSSASSSSTTTTTKESTTGGSLELKLSLLVAFISSVIAFTLKL